MTRIVHYLPGVRLELGGVVRSVLDGCAVMARRGHDVTLMTFDAPDVPCDWNGGDGKPKVVKLPAARRPNGWIGRTAVGLARKELSPGTVLHLHTPWTASNLQLASAARAAAVPYVITLHGMLNEWAMQKSNVKKRLFLLMARRYLRQARAIHCTAAAEAEQSRPWLAGARQVVLPCLLDWAPFTQAPTPELAEARVGKSAGRPTLLFLSRLHLQKGVDLVIEMARILKLRNCAFRLLIAGTGEPAYVEQMRLMVRNAQLSEQVQFIGPVFGALKLSLYRLADLFILPTRHENFGLVLAEAMACGTAVLTSRGTNIWRDVESMGGIIRDLNPSALADAVVELLATDLRARGSASREAVLSHWSEARVAPLYESLYSA